MKDKPVRPAGPVFTVLELPPFGAAFGEPLGGTVQTAALVCWAREAGLETVFTLKEKEVQMKRQQQFLI